MSSLHNRKNDILILRKGPTQGLEYTLSAEKMYSINFTVTRKGFCLSLHYNGANSYLFVNGTELLNLKQKILRLQQLHYAQETLRKEFSEDNMKKTGLNGYVYHFSVDYDAIAVDDLLETHNYLM